MVESALSSLQPEWAAKAACSGYPEAIFFPKPNQLKKIAKAKSICRKCPVRLECRDWAIEMKTSEGIFGGFTPEERELYLAIFSSSYVPENTSQTSNECTQEDPLPYTASSPFSLCIPTPEQPHRPSTFVLELTASTEDLQHNPAELEIEGLRVVSSQTFVLQVP